MLKLSIVNMKTETSFQCDFLPTLTLIKHKPAKEWALCFHWLWIGLHLRNA
jgi:hypothetical protein